MLYFIKVIGTYHTVSYVQGAQLFVSLSYRRPEFSNHIPTFYTDLDLDLCPLYKETYALDNDFIAKKVFFPSLCIIISIHCLDMMIFNDINNMISKQ